MASLGNEVFDSGLGYIDTNGTRLDITSQEATTYSEATTAGTFSLGSKTGLNVGAPADRGGGGREVTVPAISDGTVSTNGTATHWAITDGTSVLIATGSLAASQSVTATNTFTLTSFTIGIPDPA